MLILVAFGRNAMAKGQKRSGREPTKPKAEKPKPAVTAASPLKRKIAGGPETGK
jgi:hypothetical protein